MTNPKLLLVDDEPSLLNALVRILRAQFTVLTAGSGAQGLEILSRERDIAVVMSDMRMPIMNGATFLAHARAAAPDATRLLLTGQADLADAIDAVNHGNIFRFLQKPCEPAIMRGALAAAAEQNRLVLAERELLERTLRGSVQALSETLAMTAPSVFGAATRVKRTACSVAAILGLQSTWQLEIAAMMCQLGAIALPPGLYERRAHRATLTAADRLMLERVPLITEQLLQSIPRLEPVVSIIRHALGGPCEGDLAADILRAVLDFDEQEATSSTRTALATVRTMTHRHRTEVLDALATVFFGTQKDGEEVPIARLREGMIIAADVRTKTGVLIVARGHTITEALVERLRNYGHSLPSERVRVAA